MRLLHWVIADDSLLPQEFPAEWGAPPARVPQAGDGWFSVLWSDVGKDYYSVCGPTKDQHGWIARDAISLAYKIPPDHLDADPAGWTWLDERGVTGLWGKDAERMASTPPNNDHLVSFAYLPHKGVAAYQHQRNIRFLEALVPGIQHWGIVAKPDPPEATTDIFATWTLDARPPGTKTLLVTRLHCLPNKFSELFAMLVTAAKACGMEQIEIYNLPAELWPIVRRLGATNYEREVQVSAFKWYGNEDPSSVDWLYNER